MSTIKATWKDGRVQLDSPVDWPDGRRLVVAEDSMEDFDFMTEDEQSDDPEAIERWIADLEALPAMALTAEQEADLIAWRQKAKEHNLEAMRRQMNSDDP